MKEKAKLVFVHGASLMLIALASALLSQVPFLKGSELMLGVVIGAYGFEKVKTLISKLPVLK